MFAEIRSSCGGSLARRSVAGVIALAAALLAAPALGQFERTYGVALEDRSAWVVQTSDGGYIHAGSRIYGSGTTDVLVVRTNAAGTILWDRIVGGASSDFAHRVVQTQDGGFVVAGGTYSTASPFNLLMFKLSAAGALQWIFSYRGLPGDVSGLGIGLTECGNRDLVLCAREQLFSIGFAQQALTLIRTDANGILRFHRVSSDSRYGANTFASLMDVHELPNRDLIASGYTNSNFPGDFEVLFTRFDAAGNPLLGVAYNHPVHEEWASALDPAANGDFLMAGFSKHSGEGGGAFLMRIMPAGPPIWYRVIRGFGVRHSIEELANTDIILAGSTNISGNYNAALLRTDSTGAFVWGNQYGGAGQEFGEAVAPTTSGDLMLTAWTNTFGAGSYDVYAVKTNPNGRSGCEARMQLDPILEPIPHVFLNLPFIEFTQQLDFAAQISPALCSERDPCRHCVEPPSGMVAWYPLDELTGPKACEIAFGNDGKHINNPTPSPGMVAGALCFNGVNSYVEAPSANQINFGTGDLSIDAWIRTTDTSGVRVIVEKRTQTTAGTTGYSLFLSSGQLGFQLATGSGSNTCSTLPAASCTNYGSGAAVADGTWHHVAVTVRRTSATGGIWYIDGVALSNTFDPTFRTGSLTNTGKLRIGCRSISVSGVFNGCIDEVELFNRVLTPLEVADIFNAGAYGKCKDKCHVPWDSPFCAGATSIVVKARVCNCGPTPQTYSVSFAGLPANPPNCTINGPTVFTPLDPTTVTLAPRTCTDIRVRIDRPSGMNAVWQIGCYDAIFTNLNTGRVFTCHGSVQDRRDLCAVDTGGGGAGTLIVGRPRPVTFLLTNTGASRTISYRLEAMPSDMDEPAPQVVSLNGLPPGVPVEGNLFLNTGGAGTVSVQAMFTEHVPFRFYDIVLSTLDGGAAPNALISVGLMSQAVPCAGATLQGDLNCDGVVNNFDIDPFVIALVNAANYDALYPDCTITNADMNCDGTVDNFDIDPFVMCLASGNCP